MLRPQILRQLQKITTISYVKPYIPHRTHESETDLLARKLQQHITYGSLRNICLSKPLKKYNRKSGSQDLDSDSEDEADPEFKDERDSKVIKTKVNSLRADLLLKAGLGIARK